MHLDNIKSFIEHMDIDPNKRIYANKIDKILHVKDKRNSTTNKDEVTHRN